MNSDNNLESFIDSIKLDKIRDAVLGIYRGDQFDSEKNNLIQFCRRQPRGMGVLVLQVLSDIKRNKNVLERGRIDSIIQAIKNDLHIEFDDSSYSGCETKPVAIFPAMPSLQNPLVGPRNPPVDLINGRYYQLAMLGRGGFGEVWEAQQVDLIRDRVLQNVAIKFIDLPKDLNEERQQKAFEEIKYVSTLKHPNIVTSIEAGCMKKGAVTCLYHVMELADETLGDRLSRPPFPIPVNETREIAIEIANALKYMHDLKLAHRDLKPENILRIGSFWKISDFGLTRQIKNGSVATSLGAGTLRYCPPEMLRNKYTFSGDCWSFGIILFEMLTGKHPIPYAEDAQLISRLLDDFDVVAPDIPNPFHEIVTNCLKKNPSQRWNSDRILQQLQQGGWR